MSTKKYLLLLALAASMLACTCTMPYLPIPTPTPMPLLIAPPPTPTPTPTPVPVDEDFQFPAFPDYSPDDLTAQYRAMRPGFEQDVDAFADGTRYWLALNLALDPTRVYGLERVRVVNNGMDALDELVFRLYPNHMMNRTVLMVSEITVGGTALEGELAANDTVLRLPLPAPLAPGESTDIEMAFRLILGTGDNLVGFGYRNSVGGAVALPSFFPMLSVYEEGMWWEEQLDAMADPVYSEVALFDVWLRAPSDADIASTGVPVSAESEGNYTLYHFASGPVRDFALGIGRGFETVSGEVDGVVITVWSRPDNTEADNFILNVTEQAVQIFSDEFAPYPFAELDVVEVTTAASGIEYPGLYYLAGSAWRADNTFTEWVAAHETAHQWWYSIVGNDQVGEPWIDEGLTEYSSEIYFLRERGEGGGAMAHDYFVNHVGDFVDEYGEQLPVGLPADAYPSPGAYDAIVYSAGALFYEGLVETYGRDAVGEMLQVYFEQHRYGVAHNEDLEALIAEELGEEARTLFREWVYGASE